MRRWIVAGFVFAAPLASAPAAAQTLRDLQERYCTGDAFRLCSSEIPDEDRIVLCMARQRHLLSPECRAVFDESAPQPPVTPGRPRRPMTLTPQ